MNDLRNSDIHSQFGRRFCHPFVVGKLVNPNICGLLMMLSLPAFPFPVSSLNIFLSLSKHFSITYCLRGHQRVSEKCLSSHSGAD